MLIDLLAFTISTKSFCSLNYEYKYPEFLSKTNKQDTRINLVKITLPWHCYRSPFKITFPTAAVLLKFHNKYAKPIILNRRKCTCLTIEFQKCCEIFLNWHFYTNTAELISDCSTYFRLIKKPPSRFTVSHVARWRGLSEFLWQEENNLSMNCVSWSVCFRDSHHNHNWWTIIHLKLWASP